MLYNPNKKGTIILSHYRSGGTHLMLTAWLSIGEKNTTNFSEWKYNEHDYTNSTSYKKLYDLLESADKYSLLLINHPVDLYHFYQNNVFEKLKDDYEIVILERKNKVNCLLSLPLWEMFIKSGLFKDSKLWTKENMNKFHEEMLNDKIGTKGITLGYTNQTSHLNGLLKDFVADIHLLHKIENKYGFKKIYYEDFEHDSGEICSWFPTIEKDIVVEKFYQTLNKIPYVSDNYLDYYTDGVRDFIKGWKIDEL